jgi:hypothetical protein
MSKRCSKRTQVGETIQSRVDGVSYWDFCTKHDQSTIEDVMRKGVRTSTKRAKLEAICTARATRVMGAPLGLITGIARHHSTCPYPGH